MRGPLSTMRRWLAGLTLRQRLLWLIALAAPAVWSVVLLFSVDRARHEINELFDTELIRLARQLQATLPGASIDAIEPRPSTAMASGPQGAADLQDVAVAVWNRRGELLLVDREGTQLPYRPQAAGFVDMQLDGAEWRTYYLQAADGSWLVAVGQIAHERDEVVRDFIASQMLPWLLMLPLLLMAMAAAVTGALRPLAALGADLHRRAPDDLAALPVERLPSDLRPLAASMNGLFERIRAALERERRFTADAAHELRTPIAALRAQWDALQLAPAGQNDPQALAQLGLGLERLSRLVTQMLMLARLEPRAALTNRQPIDWHSVVAEVLSDTMALAHETGVELAVEWPADARAPLPLSGEPALVQVMLRNLVDNALRMSARGSTVTLRFAHDRVTVVDEGPGVAPEHLPRLGDRYWRAPGSHGIGSGLGLSIVARIAALHGLAPRFGPREDGQRGFQAMLQRLPSPPALSP
ncbi:ATP-binding protein [Caldimonas sp. KR1-144]|uniref:ATP-binding protein n=1 Tax=Caldimonas sp. KR1-144 TaxID=3400911 RepID=UPI003C04CD48